MVHLVVEGEDGTSTLTVTVLCLIESFARQGVDGVARVGAGDLLLASDVSAGLVSATEVVHEDGVGPVGLDGGIAVVHALQCLKTD